MFNQRNIIKMVSLAVGAIAVVAFVAQLGQPSPGPPSQYAMAQQVATNVASGDRLGKAVGKMPTAQAQTALMRSLWEISDAVGVQAIESAEQYANQRHPHGRQTVALTRVAAHFPLTLIVIAVFSIAAGGASRILRRI